MILRARHDFNPLLAAGGHPLQLVQGVHLQRGYVTFMEDSSFYFSLAALTDLLDLRRRGRDVLQRSAGAVPDLIAVLHVGAAVQSRVSLS